MVEELARGNAGGWVEAEARRDDALQLGAHIVEDGSAVAEEAGEGLASLLLVGGGYGVGEGRVVGEAWG